MLSARTLAIALALLVAACDGYPTESPQSEYERRMREIDAEYSAKRAAENRRYEEEKARSDAEFEAEMAAAKNERAVGEVVEKEHMGKRSVMLDGMIAPVMREGDFARVYTVKLLMVRSDAGVEIGISPKFRGDSEWVWLKCHDVGLWKDTPWATADGVEGSDGHWLHVEATYDGDVNGKSLSEWVMFPVSLDTLRELATAEASGAQVCRDKFDLSAEQRAAILALADHGTEGEQE